MPGPAFSTRSRAATAAFTSNHHRRVLLLLFAAYTHVHTQQPVNTSVFAVIGRSPLIPFTFPQGNLRLLHSSHSGVTCRSFFRCRRQRALAGDDAEARTRPTGASTARPDAAKPPQRDGPRVLNELHAYTCFLDIT